MKPINYRKDLNNLAKFCIRLLIGASLVLVALALLFPSLVDSDKAASTNSIFKPNLDDPQKAYPDRKTNVAKMDTLQDIQKRTERNNKNFSN